MSDHQSTDPIDSQILNNEFSYGSASAEAQERVIDAEVKHVTPFYKKKPVLLAIVAATAIAGSVGLYVVQAKKASPENVPADVAEITRAASDPSFARKMSDERVTPNPDVAPGPGPSGQAATPDVSAVKDANESVVQPEAVSRKQEIPPVTNDSPKVTGQDAPVVKQESIPTKSLPPALMVPPGTVSQKPAPSPKVADYRGEIDSLIARVAALEASQGKLPKTQGAQSASIQYEKNSESGAATTQKQAPDQAVTTRRASLGSMGVVALLSDGVVLMRGERQIDIAIGEKTKILGGQLVSVDPVQKIVKTTRHTWYFE